MTRIVFSRSYVNYVGTDQADQIYALGGHNIIDAGKGADLVIGGKGGDLIFGGDGMDRLEGRAGFDTLDGGRGDDILLGDDGNDQLFGSITRDQDGVVGSAGGHDILRGGNGNDLIIRALDDHAYGGNGNDQLSSYPDFASTKSTHTYLSGNAGSDRFFLNAEANGFKDIVEVLDFKRGDAGLQIDSNDGAVAFNGLTGQPTIDRDFSDPSVFGAQRVGHDVVFTTNDDLDQVIIHNADWLTI